jgi:putative transposase
VRSAITEKLKYKSRLRGVKLRLEYPRGTSHTCPRCGRAANTYKSSEHTDAVDWGGWLTPELMGVKCQHCGWNGSRDYAGAVNIGRLAAAFYQKLAAAQAAENVSPKTYRGFKISDLVHQPTSYIGAGAALPIPLKVTRKKSLFFCSAKLAKLSHPAYYLTGWLYSAAVVPKCQPGVVTVCSFVQLL